MARSKAQIVTPTKQPRRKVSLDTLFRVCSDETLPDGRKVYLRVASSTDLSLTAQAASATSNRAKKAVTTEGTQEYDANILDLATYSREDLIATILGISSFFEWQRIKATIKPEHQPVPEPDPDRPDVMGETRREVEDKRDKEHDLTYEAQSNALQDWAKEYKETLDAYEDARLYKECRRLKEVSYANTVFNSSYNDHLLLATCFKDSEYTQPFFTNIQEVQGLNDKVKNKLLAAYIELDNTDDTELANLS